MWLHDFNECVKKGEAAGQKHNLKSTVNQIMNNFHSKSNIHRQKKFTGKMVNCKILNKQKHSVTDLH